MPLTICKGQGLEQIETNNYNYVGLRQQQMNELNHEKQDKSNKIIDSKVDRIRERIDMYTGSWTASKANDKNHK